MVEAIKDARQVLFGDPDAVILHDSENLVVFAGAQADVHVTALGAELDGIIDQAPSARARGILSRLKPEAGPGLV